MTRLPAAGFCPPGGCPARVDELVELAALLAFAQGRAYERAELAETEATWKPLARKTYEQQVAERMASLPGRTPAAPLRFDDSEWPAVAVPGGGGLRLGAGQVIDAVPDYLARIGEPAPCHCVRLPGDKHRYPDDSSPIGAAA
ncbi:hypothetical protein [Micromonospora sp. LOL_024]|uniref:hypothetical protein n=1 Tax=Micromonospora sp. LOL_024 TaxID=3345412 RepID=UPI003A8696CE